MVQSGRPLLRLGSQTQTKLALHVAGFELSICASRVHQARHSIPERLLEVFLHRRPEDLRKSMPVPFLQMLSLDLTTEAPAVIVLLLGLQTYTLDSNGVP